MNEMKNLLKILKSRFERQGKASVNLKIDQSSLFNLKKKREVWMDGGAFHQFCAEKNQSIQGALRVSDQLRWSP